MTERVGFEPTMQFDPHTPLAGERLRPLDHLSSYQLVKYNTPLQKCPALFLKIFEKVAERVGFEPTEPGKSSTVFKTASLNRSDTPPEQSQL